MPRNPNPPQAEELPVEVVAEVAPEVTPEVAPVAAPVAAPVDGPVIDFIGENARDVKFTVNPNAERYVVNGSNGIVLEYL